MDQKNQQQLKNLNTVQRNLQVQSHCIIYIAFNYAFNYISLEFVSKQIHFCSVLFLSFEQSDDNLLQQTDNQRKTLIFFISNIITDLYKSKILSLKTARSHMSVGHLIQISADDMSVYNSRGSTNIMPYNLLRITLVETRDGQTRLYGVHVHLVYNN